LKSLFHTIQKNFKVIHNINAYLKDIIKFEKNILHLIFVRCIEINNESYQNDKKERNKLHNNFIISCFITCIIKTM
jgi:hypothetical protein